jgi:hypothetical protein
MAKLQAIERKNGSVVHSVNLPYDVVEEIGWKKGDELCIERKEKEIIISKD